MPPEQLPNYDAEIQTDAIIEQNNKLDDITQSSENQVQGIIETNTQLDELNRGVEMIVEQIGGLKLDEKIAILDATIKSIQLTDYTPQIEQVISLLTDLNNRPTPEIKPEIEFKIEVNGEEIESATMTEEDVTEPNEETNS